MAHPRRRPHQNDITRLIAAASDSGMRLAEVIGLIASDFHLNDEAPFLRLSEHQWRRLKTATACVSADVIWMRAGNRNQQHRMVFLSSA